MSFNCKITVLILPLSQNIAHAKAMAQELADLPNEPAPRDANARLAMRRSLARALGVKLPRKAKKGPMELAARSATFHDKTPEEISLLTAKLAKAACAAAFASLRTIRDLQAIVHLNTTALARIKEELVQVRRSTARLDRPLNIIETMDNPDLNPNLAGNIPFNDAQAMVAFLQSVERSTALQRYIWVQVKWSASTFTSKMVRTLFTYAFRDKYDWPGGLRYKGKEYLPDKIKKFLINVTSFVANKSGGHFDLPNVERQLRTLFQDSQVGREREKDEARQAALDAEKKKRAKMARRKRPAEESQGQEGEEEAVPTKKGKTSSSAKQKKSHEEDDQSNDKDEDSAHDGDD